MGCEGLLVLHALGLVLGGIHPVLNGDLVEG